jgi:hypothetical protein
MFSSDETLPDTIVWLLRLVRSKRGKIRYDFKAKVNSSERPKVAFAYELPAHVENLTVTKSLAYKGYTQ